MDQALFEDYPGYDERKVRQVMVQMAVVRDRTPVVLSPQCVGREFVRQYYTVLNQDPLKLHRFYTKHSRFLHGDSANGHSENPVMGQEAIYKKIQDLNFVDCRTKIRQVDSHSTLSEGVVVQVSGELSNNGRSMRRFMQTFVLAPGEDTRKYYVHNDIFRYQDEVFPEETSDETADGTVDSEGEEEPNNQVTNGVTNYEQDSVLVQNVVTPDVPANTLYYADSRNNGESSGLIQNQMMEEESQELQEIVVDKQLSEVTLTESAREIPEMKPAEPEEAEPTHLQQVPSEEAPPDIFRDARDEEPAQESPKPEEKPKTWAAMLGRSSGIPSMTPPPPAKPQPKVTPPRPVVQPAVSKPTPPRERPGFVTKEARMAARNARNAPDDHQVFIGNLPNGVRDAEVREVFSKYGSILEIRLNPKNFGFVIFNSPDPVKQILIDKPIKIGSHEINIEEKKPSGARRDTPAGVGRGIGGKGGGRGGGGGGPGGRTTPGGVGAGGRGGGGFGGNPRGGRRSNGSSTRGGKFPK